MWITLKEQERDPGVFWQWPRDGEDCLAFPDGCKQRMDGCEDWTADHHTSKCINLTKVINLRGITNVEADISLFLL